MPSSRIPYLFNPFFLFLALFSLFLSPLPPVKGNPKKPDSIPPFGFKGFEIYKFNESTHLLHSLDLNNDGEVELIFFNEDRARLEILGCQIKNPSEKEKAPTGSPLEPEIGSEKEDVNEVDFDKRMGTVGIVIERRLNGLGFLDINGDGLKDIIVSGDPREVMVYLQQPHLTFEPGDPIELSDGHTNTPSRNLILGPFKDNQGVEFLYLEGKKNLWKIFPEEGQLRLDNVLPFNSASIEKGFETLKIGDITGDGYPDLIILTRGVSGNLIIRQGNAEGNFDPEIHFDLPESQIFDLGQLDSKPGLELVLIAKRTGRAMVFQFTKRAVKNNLLTETVPLPFEGKGEQRVFASVSGKTWCHFFFSGGSPGELLKTGIIGENQQLLPFEKVSSYHGVHSLLGFDRDGDGNQELIIFSEKEKSIGVSRVSSEGSVGFPEKIEGILGEPIAVSTGVLTKKQGESLLVVSKTGDDYIFQSLAQGQANFSPLVMKDFKTGKLKELKCHDLNGDGLGDLILFFLYEGPRVFLQRAGGGFELPKKWDSLKSFLPENLSSKKINFIQKGDPNILASDLGAGFFYNLNYCRLFSFESSESFDSITFHKQYNSDNPEFSVSLGVLTQLVNPLKPAMALFDEFKGKLSFYPLLLSQKKVREDIQVGKMNLIGHFKYPQQPSLKNPETLYLIGNQKFSRIRNVPFEPFLKEIGSYESTIKNGVLFHLVIGDLNGDKKNDLIFAEQKKHGMELVSLDHGQLKRGLHFPIFDEKQFKGGVGGLSAPREWLIDDFNQDGWNDLALLIHDKVILYLQDTASPSVSPQREGGP